MKAYSRYSVAHSAGLCTIAPKLYSPSVLLTCYKTACYRIHTVEYLWTHSTDSQ